MLLRFALLGERCVADGRDENSFLCLGWRGLRVMKCDPPFLRGAVSAHQALREQHAVAVGEVAADIVGHLQVPLPTAVPHGSADEGQQPVLGAGAGCPARP